MNIYQAELKKLMDNALREILEECSPKAVYFVGSFGRDEAALAITETKYKFISDCEICIIPKSYICKNKISKIQYNISQKADIDAHLAICHGLSVYSSIPFQKSFLKILWNPRIAMFDFKYGSKLIYGNDLLKLLPDIDPCDISLWEGIRLILNRIAESLEYLSYPLEMDSRTLYWVSKIIISCQDVLLLSRNRYNSSYRVRNSMFVDVAESFPDDLQSSIKKLVPLAIAATNYKLCPDNNIYKKSLKSIWFDVMDICNDIFRYIVNLDAGITFDTYIDFQKAYLENPKVEKKYYSGYVHSPIFNNIILMFFNFYLLKLEMIKKINISWMHLMFSTIPLIYFSISRNGAINRRYLDQARANLMFFKVLDKSKPNDLDEWNYLRHQLFIIWQNTCESF